MKAIARSRSHQKVAAKTLFQTTLVLFLCTLEVYQRAVHDPATFERVALYNQVFSSCAVKDSLASNLFEIPAGYTCREVPGTRRLLYSQDYSWLMFHEYYQQILIKLVKILLLAAPRPRRSDSVSKT